MFHVLRCIRISVTVVAAVGVGAVLASAAPIRIHGSDLLGAGFAQQLRDYARANEAGLELTLDGSRGAGLAIERGRADVALVLLRPDQEPPAGECRSVPLAFMAALVSVRDGSPLTQISLRQLAAIYGAGAVENTTRWGDLGVSGEWAGRPILPIVTTGDADLSLELFRQIVLRGGELKGVVATETGRDAVWAKLAVESGAIAITNGSKGRPAGSKTLLVAKTDEDVAFGPTPENLKAGDYPLQLTLWLVIRRDFTGPGLGWARFILGREMAAALVSADWVPLPEAVREQTMFELER